MHYIGTISSFGVTTIVVVVVVHVHVLVCVSARACNRNDDASRKRVPHHSSIPIMVEFRAAQHQFTVPVYVRTYNREVRRVR